jgi:hypothetical protein
MQKPMNKVWLKTIGLIGQARKRNDKPNEKGCGKDFAHGESLPDFSLIISGLH